MLINVVLKPASIASSSTSPAATAACWRGAARHELLNPAAPGFSNPLRLIPRPSSGRSLEYPHDLVSAHRYISHRLDAAPADLVRTGAPAAGDRDQASTSRARSQETPRKSQ